METSSNAGCAYCGTERPASELKSGKISFRNRNSGGKAFMDTRTSLYCADKPCHGNDQMAHEG